MSAVVQPRAIVERAMRLVERGERDAWLGLFAADAVIEDPVGHVPPRQGAAQLAEFWDTAIAGAEEVRFDIRRVHEAPGEALAVAEVAVRAPGGAGATYDVAVHYRFDDDGAIVALRAFWDLSDVVAQLAADAD
jgi:ketosteroid isomerase-like protein